MTRLECQLLFSTNTIIQIDFINIYIYLCVFADYIRGVYCSFVARYLR